MPEYLMSFIKNKYLLTILLFLILTSTSVGENLKDQYSAENIAKAVQLKSFRSFGTIKMGETIGTIETLYSEPGFSKSTLALGDFQVSQIFDGEIAWMRDQNGQVIELTGADKKQLVNTGWLLGKSYILENRMPGHVEYFKDTVIGSENYSIYSALPEGGDSIQLFFNSVTGRIEIIGERLDESKIYTFLSDFREVNGFETPFIYETKSAVSELNSTVEISDFDVNLQLDDSLFTFSVIKADDYFFPDNTDSVIVPVVYRSGHIYLKASINGNPAVYFMLDSGAGINFINRRYADSLRLDISGGLPAKGISGYETTAITNLDSLKIGDLKLSNQNVAIINLARVGLNVPEGIFGGLLGYDVLSRFPMRIDYVNQNIVIYMPDSYRAPSMDYAVNLEYNMKIPVVNAEICGVSGKFLIDLGNSLGLILHKPFVDNNNNSLKFADISKVTSGLSGVGGKSEAYSAIARYFAFGPAYLKEVRVLVAEGEQGILKSTDVDGNIGNGLLQNFSIVLNYSEKKMYIMPLEGLRE